MRNHEFNRLKYQKNGFIGVFTRKHFSSKISLFLAHSRLTPNQITFFSLVLALVGIYFLSTGERLNLIIAGILIFLSKIFDAVDGELARLKGLVTERGGWLDGISDRFKENMLFLGLTFGLYHQSPSPVVWLYGFLAIISIHMLSIVLEHTGKMDPGILQRTQEGTFIVKIARRLGIKPQYLALQADVYFFITSVLIIANQLKLILWFYMVVMNFYWLIIVFLVYKKKKLIARIPPSRIPPLKRLI
ncbi:MAG TPA: CDP-alcohol phosphatidyltransferase family protein [Candidatus Nanoarchaeia archaeon]|nr:CDP-alcohol phosphatidyltransferase family protein [Candidatus Nanoarchaeia archaeon]